MSRSITANFVYSFIVWLPILAVAFAAMWWLAVGVMHLEIGTYGSEFFVKNSETANVPAWKLGGSGQSADSTVAMLESALNSGDPVRMQAALDSLETP